jgi:inner membrane protease subunit 2
MARQLLRSLTWVPVGYAVGDLLVAVHRVEGASMRPALNPDSAAADSAAAAAASSSHDVVLAEKLSVRLYRWSRGDVVLLHSPVEPRRLLIKRLVALEGDFVSPPRAGGLAAALVPAGHGWVEGDNSGASEDSGAFGPVPLALLQARAVAVVWPPSRWGALERKQPPGRVLALADPASEAWW